MPYPPISSSAHTIPLKSQGTLSDSIFYFNVVEMMYLQMPQENYKNIGINSRTKVKNFIVLIVSMSFQNVQKMD